MSKRHQYIARSRKTRTGQHREQRLKANQALSSVSCKPHRSRKKTLRHPSTRMRPRHLVHLSDDTSTELLLGAGSFMYDPSTQRFYYDI